MNWTVPAYAWLAGSIAAAVLMDTLLMRVLLELLKPTSAYAFWAARASKLAVLAGWFLFIDRFWYAWFGPGGDGVPVMLQAAEWGLWLAALLLAVVSLPRVRRRGGEHA